MNSSYRIKIAFIIDSINSVAGTEKQLVQMLQMLNCDLFDAKLICLRKPSGIFKIDKRPIEKFEYIELDLKRLASFRGLIRLIWLICYLRKEKIDIVQNFFFDATVIGALAGRIAGVKNIISCRRDLGFWYTSRLLRILKIINRITTRILVNSYAVKENVAKHENVPENKIDVIKNGINLDLFGRTSKTEDNLTKSFGIPNEDYIVGIMANLNRSVKRVDVFLKAAAEVLRVIPNVSFVILGDGYLRNELNSMVERLGILEKVFFLGRKDEIYSVIANWDIGIISSDSEGFSNSILEYMASGIPVIATNVGGNKEVIKEGVNGLLVSPGDYKSMTKMICALLNDRKRRLQMGKEGSLIVQQKYAWDSKIKEIEGYYQSITGKHRNCY